MDFGFHRLQGDVEQTERVTVTLTVFGKTVTQDVEVPSGPTLSRRMLPVFQSLAHTLIDHAVAREQRAGNSISCKRGCGVCCQQLVPIPPAEAHAIAALVEALPEPQRSGVRARLAEARERLEASGLAARLREQVWNDDDDSSYNTLALDYFALHIACPFLDDEGACAIYPDRPVVCREFLVISTAEDCSSPAPGKVRAIPLPGQVSRALARLDPLGGKPGAPWTPLTLAVEWSVAHPEGKPDRTGLEVIKAFFEREKQSAEVAPRTRKKRRGRR
jgi:Fe-S-cluster containining protein